MLRSLHIENIAVIRKTDVEFDRGLTVLTGETGAGKSILIDSVGLLLGAKFNRELLRTGEQTATVSAVFDELSEDIRRTIAEMGFETEEGSVCLQRTLYADGRTTFRLCGRPLTATMARELGKSLLSIHGQNDNQKLLQKSAHLALLDAMDTDGGLNREKQTYAALYRDLRACENECEELNRGDAEKARMREMLEYQIRDIASAKLREGEEVALGTERDKLRNAERIAKYVRFTEQVLDSSERSGSVASLLGRSADAMRHLADVIPEAETLSEQLDDMMYRVRDIAGQVSAWGDGMDADPTARLDAIEGRLDLISRLQRKYGKDTGEILAFAARAKEQLAALEDSDERLQTLRERCEKLRADCRRQAELLHERRTAVAEQMTQRVCEELAFLDMPKVRFSVLVRPTGDFLPTGRDDVEFMIATNPGEPLMPMIKIASGGELSRLMLAIKSVLNDRDGVGCVVFDEVDTGISGRTSRKVGIRLCQMGRRVQVICITHAAQIASLADHHALITKTEVDGRIETQVHILDDEGRVEEVARILGGLEITETQRTAAREMIAERQNI